jgi:hypothetical protein
MTRGRPPKKARWEAAKSAAQWGEVLEAAGIARSRIDFIQFVRHQVLFIRVKRSHSRIRSPQELRVLFSDEIAGLHTLPLTAVVSRELWVLLPWGAWQYFCIGDDGIWEIHKGNRMGSGTDEQAEVVQDQGKGNPDESMKRNGEDENAAGMQDTGGSGSPDPSDGGHTLPDQDIITRE